MKNAHLLLLSFVLVFAACSRGIQNADQENVTRDSTQNADLPLTAQGLITKMTMSPVVSLTDSINFRFTVYNQSDSVQTFCKWHTPFEPLISKYLDVRDEAGNEVDYKGAMAKRMMPPPADSYITVNKGDSLSVVTDLKKGYAIQKPGKYTVKYNSSGMSGLVMNDSLQVTVK